MRIDSVLSSGVPGRKSWSGLTRFQNSFVSNLMASHADVVRQIRSEPGRINDGGILDPAVGRTFHDTHV